MRNVQGFRRARCYGLVKPCDRVSMFYDAFSRGMLALVGEVLDAILWRTRSRGRASLKMS